MNKSKKILQKVMNKSKKFSKKLNKTIKNKPTLKKCEQFCKNDFMIEMKKKCLKTVLRNITILINRQQNKKMSLLIIRAKKHFVMKNAKVMIFLAINKNK